MPIECLDVLQALYDHDPVHSEQEIAVKQHQILLLISKEEDDWWKVKSVSHADDPATVQCGLVPRIYLGEAPQNQYVRASFNYNPVNPSDIKLIKGEILQYFVSDDNWLLVKSNRLGEIGFVPGGYVEARDEATPSPAAYTARPPPAYDPPPSTSAIPEVSVEAPDAGPSTSTPTSPIASVKWDFTGVNDDELSVKARDSVTVLHQSGDWWVCRSAAGRDGMDPATYLKVLQTQQSPKVQPAPRSPNNSKPLPVPGDPFEEAFVVAKEQPRSRSLSAGTDASSESSTSVRPTPHKRASSHSPIAAKAPRVSMSFISNYIPNENDETNSTASATTPTRKGKERAVLLKSPASRKSSKGRLSESSPEVSTHREKELELTLQDLVQKLSSVNARVQELETKDKAQAFLDVEPRPLARSATTSQRPRPMTMHSAPDGTDAESVVHARALQVLRDQLKAKEDAHAKRMEALEKELELQAIAMTELRDQLDTSKQIHIQDLAAVKEHMSCEVCMEDLWKSFILAECGHHLCQGCLLSWFQSNQSSGRQSRKPMTCPHCRKPVTVRPIEMFFVQSVVKTVHQAQLRVGVSVDEEPDHTLLPKGALDVFFPPKTSARG